MRVMTARVVDGKIDIGEELEEGSTVAVLAIEPRLPQLSPEDEQELVDALEEIHAGHYVDGRQLVAELRAHAAAWPTE